MKDDDDLKNRLACVKLFTDCFAFLSVICEINLESKY